MELVQDSAANSRGSSIDSEKQSLEKEFEPVVECPVRDGHAPVSTSGESKYVPVEPMENVAAPSSSLELEELLAKKSPTKSLLHTLSANNSVTKDSDPTSSTTEVGLEASGPVADYSVSSSSFEPDLVMTVEESIAPDPESDDSSSIAADVMSPISESDSEQDGLVSDKAMDAVSSSSDKAEPVADDSIARAPTPVSNVQIKFVEVDSFSKGPDSDQDGTKVDGSVAKDPIPASNTENVLGAGNPLTKSIAEASSNVQSTVVGCNPSANVSLPSFNLPQNMVLLVPIMPVRVMSNPMIEGVIIPKVARATPIVNPRLNKLTSNVPSAKGSVTAPVPQQNSLSKTNNVVRDSVPVAKQSGSCVTKDIVVTSLSKNPTKPQQKTLLKFKPVAEDPVLVSKQGKSCFVKDTALVDSAECAGSKDPVTLIPALNTELSALTTGTEVGKLSLPASSSGQDENMGEISAAEDSTSQPSQLMEGLVDKQSAADATVSKSDCEKNKLKAPQGELIPPACNIKPSVSNELTANILNSLDQEPPRLIAAPSIVKEHLYANKRRADEELNKLNSGKRRRTKDNRAMLNSIKNRIVAANSSQPSASAELFINSLREPFSQIPEHNRLDAEVEILEIIRRYKV